MDEPRATRFYQGQAAATSSLPPQSGVKRQQTLF
jgi:hypothetical protein